MADDIPPCKYAYREITREEADRLTRMGLRLLELKMMLKPRLYGANDTAQIVVVLVQDKWWYCPYWSAP